MSRLITIAFGNGHIGLPTGPCGPAGEGEVRTQYGAHTTVTSTSARYSRDEAYGVSTCSTVPIPNWKIEHVKDKGDKARPTGK